MENSKATVSLLLDTRREKKNKTYPVKLSVYFEGDKRRYKTGHDVSEVEWTKLYGANLRDDDLKLLKRKLNAKKEKAESLIDKMESFTFEEFEELFFREKKVRQSSDLKTLFDDYIEILEKAGRIGSASIYRTTLNSLLDYKPKIKASDVTKNFLEDYEQHLLHAVHRPSSKSKSKIIDFPKGISPTTIGIYMRQLRAIINIAISKGLLSQDKYPFKGYSIPSSRNVKKALQAQHIKKLLQYKTDDGEKQKAIDFWLFSYISNGINFTDICCLVPSDIKGEFFSFYRAKTMNTRKRDKRPIKVPLTAETKAIIQKWRSTEPKNPYLFPILKHGLTPKQKKYKIQDFIWKVNRQMNAIAVEIGFEGKIGTYVARHSHSTILKRQGVSTEFIKENLGHASVVTTENYLDDFEDDVKLEYARKLTEL
ncbi:MAG: phage integrase SAM-like domain-containing protein [Flavisolibacter sp.]